MDLFEMMGFEAPAEETKETKGVKKTKKADKSSKSNKKAVEYTLPVDLVIPYCDKIAGFNIEGKASATEKDILEEIQKRCPWLVCAALVKINESTLEIKYRSGGTKKGTVKGSTLMYGNTEIPFDSGEDGTDVEALKKAFYDNVIELNGCPVSFIAHDDIIVPVLEPQKMGKELKLTQQSVTVITPGVAVSQIDLTDKKVLTPEDILAVAPDSLKDNLVPCVFKLNNVQTVVLMPSKQVEYAATAPSVKSFSIADNVQISLGFTKIDLSPDDFDGMEEVEAKDICAYIVAQGWPEFSWERTTIEKVNKHLLVAILKSSSKGALNG